MNKELNEKVGSGMTYRFPTAVGRVFDVYFVFTPLGVVVGNAAEDAAYKRGEEDGEAAAYFDLPGYATGSNADRPGYARGFEAGYDANWERADKIRSAFGVE